MFPVSGNRQEMFTSMSEFISVSLHCPTGVGHTGPTRRFVVRSRVNSLKRESLGGQARSRGHIGRIYQHVRYRFQRSPSIVDNRQFCDKTHERRTVLMRSLNDSSQVPRCIFNVKIPYIRTLKDLFVVVRLSDMWSYER